MISYLRTKIETPLTMTPLIECVPNISEGRDLAKINAIAGIVETVEGVKLLEVDPGISANRTVITFIGPPEQVIEAAFRLIKKAAELIDMRLQTGEHPRMGATDVCPLVPISGIEMQDLIPYARRLGDRVGRELNIPGYFYEKAALQPKRSNLAYCRQGEYEGLGKLSTVDGKPDFGPSEFNDSVKKSGATVIGARDFLIAYNINLNSTSARKASAVASDIRESGRVKREGNLPTGKIILNETGEPMRIPGTLKAVKGIGWYIEEYGISQVSLNITNIHITPVHIAFEEVFKKAAERGMRVTGSELVGLIPLKCLVDAGDFFLAKQNRSAGISEKEKIKIAVESLGLDDLSPFDPNKKIIEYLIRDHSRKRLTDLSLIDFADKTASESYLPGGGSTAAYCAALGASLGIMTANVSANKIGWEDKWEDFSKWAKTGEQIKNELIKLVDEDVIAYQAMIDAYKMPKNTEEETTQRKEAILHSTKNAINIPLQVAQTAEKAFDIIGVMVEKGNMGSVTDAGVGGVFTRCAIKASVMNIRINIKNFEDNEFKSKTLKEAARLEAQADIREKQITQLVCKRLGL